MLNMLLRKGKNRAKVHPHVGSVGDMCYLGKKNEMLREPPSKKSTFEESYKRFNEEYCNCANLHTNQKRLSVLSPQCSTLPALMTLRKIYKSHTFLYHILKP